MWAWPPAGRNSGPGPPEDHVLTCVCVQVPRQAASCEDGCPCALHPQPGRPPPASARLRLFPACLLTCSGSLQVPAGLHVDLQVQLLAVAAGESEEPQTRLHHDLVIQTELEILHLPITASVLPPARLHPCPGL